MDIADPITDKYKKYISDLEEFVQPHQFETAKTVTIKEQAKCRSVELVIKVKVPK